MSNTSRVALNGNVSFSRQVFAESMASLESAGVELSAGASATGQRGGYWDYFVQERSDQFWPDSVLNQQQPVFAEPDYLAGGAAIAMHGPYSPRNNAQVQSSPPALLPRSPGMAVDYARQSISARGPHDSRARLATGDLESRYLGEIQGPSAIHVDVMEQTVAEMRQKGSLDAEFAKIKKDSMAMPASFNTASESQNVRKNRYGNVLPIDDTRVVLSHTGVVGSDYINANYIDGWRRERAFIATQAPVPGSIQDFWRMIWEENSSIIVMATREVEMGKVKCHKYWPDEGGVVQCGAVEVSFVSYQDVNTDFGVRKLLLTDMQRTQSREVTQYCLKTWPDQGVPSDPAIVIRLILEVRRENEIARARGDGSGPVVVHCSAGIGRTGTYFAVDIGMQRMDELGTIDVPSVVSFLRAQRAGTVQTLVQYRFIYEALLAYHRTSGRTPGAAGWSAQDNRDSIITDAQRQQLAELAGDDANYVNTDSEYLVRALTQL